MNKEKGNGSSLPIKQLIEVNNLLKTLANQNCSCRNLKNMSIVAALENDMQF